MKSVCALHGMETSSGRVDESIAIAAEAYLDWVPGVLSAWDTMSFRRPGSCLRKASRISDWWARYMSQQWIVTHERPRSYTASLRFRGRTASAAALQSSSAQVDWLDMVWHAPNDEFQAQYTSYIRRLAKTYWLLALRSIDCRAGFRTFNWVGYGLFTIRLISEASSA